MTLLEQVSQQLKDAMRAKDARRLSALVWYLGAALGLEDLLQVVEETLGVGEDPRGCK